MKSVGRLRSRIYHYHKENIKKEETQEMKRTIGLYGIAILILLMGITLLPVVKAHAEGVVNLNTATAEEITAIEDVDIPEDLAQAIVDYRTQNGKFSKPADLLKVPGMDQDLLDELDLKVKDGDVVYEKTGPTMKAY
jgi:competence ComEA-like helix-hairpin-helix protein